MRFHCILITYHNTVLLHWRVWCWLFHHFFLFQLTATQHLSPAKKKNEIGKNNRITTFTGKYLVKGLYMYICLCFWLGIQSEKVIIGQLHDDDIWLQLPEFISVLLCYLNLSILLRIKDNKLKDSGSCSKMTSSCNCPISVSR